MGNSLLQNKRSGFSMNELLIAIVPAVVAFIGAIWKSNSDLKKQQLQHEAKISEIKLEAAERREEDRKLLESRIKELKAETDEELRKADAELNRKFLERFTNPMDLAEQIEGLSRGLESIPKLQEQMDTLEREKEKRQSQRGWKR